MEEHQINDDSSTAVDTSSSGFIGSGDFFISSQLTDITQLAMDKKGGYCRLFKAIRMGKWCVLKCLKPEYISNPEFNALLQKEFEIGYQLSHPHIVQMISLEQIGELGLCIIMEYIDGMSLSEWIKTSKHSDQEISKVMQTIGKTMDYIHQHQIVHRDLKPSNILITHNGNYVKIIDFGLADTDNYAVLKQPAGTRKYMAPEQKEGKLTLDGRADIYSFGVILDEINHMPGHHNRMFGHIAHKCCEPDRDKRYATLSEIRWEYPYLHLWKIAISIFLLVIVAVCALLILSDHPKTNQLNHSESVSTSQSPITDTDQTVKPKPRKEAPQSTKAETSSKTTEQNIDTGKLELRIRKMTHDYWAAYIHYIESCPKEIVTVTPAKQFGPKIIALESSYKKQLNTDIRTFVSTVIPPTDPHFRTLLLQAETISQSETHKIENDPQCIKQLGEAMNKVIAANGEYIMQQMNAK
jgi:serine/threonine protein kinase